MILSATSASTWKVHVKDHDDDDDDDDEDVSRMIIRIDHGDDESDGDDDEEEKMMMMMMMMMLKGQVYNGLFVLCFKKSISWVGAATHVGAEDSIAYLPVDGGGLLLQVCIRVSGLYGSTILLSVHHRLAVLR